MSLIFKRVGFVKVGNRAKRGRAKPLRTLFGSVLASLDQTFPAATKQKGKRGFGQPIKGWVQPKNTEENVASVPPLIQRLWLQYARSSMNICNVTLSRSVIATAKPGDGEKNDDCTVTFLFWKSAGHNKLWKCQIRWATASWTYDSRKSLRKTFILRLPKSLQILFPFSSPVTGTWPTMSQSRWPLRFITLGIKPLPPR